MKTIKFPATLMRPAPFWSWNDKLDEKELRRQIQEMAQKGWGSYFMHSRVGLVTGYLSDEWMSLVNACADEAEKTGTFAWLYDEDKWPSGFAGGLVPEKNPAYRARGLVLVRKGAATKDDTVLSFVNYAGKDYEICLRVSALGEAWFNGASYADLMNPEAVREFINLTHEKYKKFCGRHFGRAIPGIFTDEPCYIYQDTYRVPVIPWSDYLPDFFRELKGYDLSEKLPLLFFDLDGYRKVRFDFYDAATELFKRSFTKQYYDWCQQNNLIMTGHFMAEDSFLSQTRESGDVMSHYEFMHWPGIDKLCRSVAELVTVKQVSSAADQLGKERTFCEVFGCTGHQVSFFHRKWIGDWQAALGINFINHHLSLYSMRGERKRDYPPTFFYQQPWWEEERGFADYQARLCAAVTEGERIVNVLLFQPLSSLWCEYSPRHLENDYAAENAFDAPFNRISHLLMAEKMDFHYGNENLMAKYGSAAGQGLKVGKYVYECVIIPPCSNLKSSTLSLFRGYLKAGGRLICAGTKPFLVDGVAAEIGLEGALSAGSIEEAVQMVSGFFPNRIKVVDNLTGENAPAVYLHSRKYGGSFRHLIVNTDEKREVKATITMPEYRKMDMAVFDLCDGNFYRIPARDGSFQTTMAPAGSLLVVCGEEAREAKNKPLLFLGSGVSFANLPSKPPELLIEKFNCEVMEENVLLLNDFALEMDGKEVYRGPVCGAWHTHFYPALDGTSFKLTYIFHSEIKLKDCFAAIEVAENLDSVTFNGKRLKPAKKPGELGSLNCQKSWKDINFTKVPLPEIEKGGNILILEGKKFNNITGPGKHARVNRWQEHRPTEAEEVYICGRFSLKCFSAGRYVITAFKSPSGKDLTREGFPFYCGRIRFEADFNFNNFARLNSFPDGKRQGERRTILELNGVKAACAVVRLNGKNCGLLRWSPYILDISGKIKPGVNRLEIELSSTLVNAFGPNRTAGLKEENYVGPVSFVQMDRFSEEYQFFSFGMESAALSYDR
ncbi:MAG: glycosyl hydrolase [Candidatus Omnitrophica bacterium]|nr:glycosyl hydrolase [Candidatus Omnitrophota bacterium]